MKRASKPSRWKKQISKFEQLARRAARTSGQAPAFGVALAIIVAWAITGPLFHFNDTWQLVINTLTTLVTFLMVFLIQSTQNRDSEAMQIKLDELIRSLGDCHNAVLDIEELTEAELDELKRGYRRLARKALEDLRRGKSDLGVPELKKT